MTHEKDEKAIPGTVVFDGREAMKGYPLNKMCFSFNEEANRREFLRDEDAYCGRYNLNEEQKQAIRDRNVRALIAAGGHIYYLAKFVGIFGMTVQEVGAEQRGISLEAFNEMLERY